MDPAEAERFFAARRAEMLAWVHDQLAARGIRVSGPIENRDRAWSMIMRVPTADGPVWFKANSPASRFEPALTLVLGRWTPANVLTPLAVDTARGWSLLPDAGTRLRELLGAAPDPLCWEAPLREYAQLQRTAAGHVDELLALGVPDLRPQRLPDLFDLVLSSPQLAAQIGVPGGLPAERYAALRGQRPTFTRWCERLAASGVPPSIDHADLHDGQVFRGADGWVLIDWADASIGHPFMTLSVAIQRVAERFSLAADSAVLARLLDAYLETWTAEHDIAELREAARLAMPLGVIGRAMAWRRIFPGTDALIWDMHGRDVARSLGGLLDAFRRHAVSPASSITLDG
jgi:hypothetical protein